MSEVAGTVDGSAREGLVMALGANTSGVGEWNVAHGVGEWNMNWHHPQGHGQFMVGDVRNFGSEVANVGDGSVEGLAMASGAHAKRQRLS